MLLFTLQLSTVTMSLLKITVVPSAIQHGHYIMFLCFHSSVADSKMPSRTEFISGRMHVFPLLHVPAKQLSLKLIGMRTDSFLTLL